MWRALAALFALSLVADPAPTAPILETLKNDPALYVRSLFERHPRRIAVQTILTGDTES